MTSVKARRVFVRWRAGPTWKSGAVTEQPRWDEHAAFIDELIDRGVFVLGGPLADWSGSLSFFENMSVDEVRETIAKDPFVENGVFELEDVREWLVFVDELSRR
jgi:uncharacterized protein YciI